MNELTLYGMVDELKQIESLIEINEGEIETTEEERMSLLSALISQKTDACILYINSQDDLIAMAEAKVKILQDYIKARKNRVESFENYIMECMDRLGVDELKGDLYRFKKRKPAEVLVIEDENKVPAEFTVVETLIKVKKAELKKAVKDGLKIEGIHLGEGKRSLMKSLKTGK